MPVERVQFLYKKNQLHHTYNKNYYFFDTGSSIELKCFGMSHEHDIMTDESLR